MQLTEHLSTHITRLNEQFEFLLKNYEQLDDTIRIKTSKQIFDLIRKLIQTDVNVIYPQALSIDSLAPHMSHSEERHQALEEQIEKILMLHVDEPEAMYINEMTVLREMLSPLERQDTNTLTQLEAILNPDEKKRLHQQLSISMTEAQPVS